MVPNAGSEDEPVCIRTKEKGRREKGREWEIVLYVVWLGKDGRDSEQRERGLLLCHNFLS